MGWALLAAVLFNVAAIIGAVGASEGTAVAWLVEAALAPGFAWPSAYWGAAHDPLQFLVGLVLNIAIHAIIFAVIGGAVQALAAGRP